MESSASSIFDIMAFIAFTDAPKEKPGVKFIHCGKYVRFNCEYFAWIKENEGVESLCREFESTLKALKEGKK